MATDQITLFKNILSENGYHITKARQAAFSLLVSPEPQSIREILDKSKGNVDRVSMYRNIELFEKLGIVRRIYIGWKYKLELSDAFVSHHHHLSCLRCGAITDIGDEKHIDEFIQHLAKEFNFTVRGHQFEIDGYCTACQPA